MERKRLSGHARKKAAEAKKKLDSDMRRQTTSITTFFTSTSDCSGDVTLTPSIETTSNSTLDVEVHETEAGEPEQITFASPAEDSAVHDEASTSQSTPTDTELASAEPITTDISTDPGAWDTDSRQLVSYWIQRGPKDCQNRNADFSLSAVEIGGKHRKLTSSLFKRVMPNGEVVERDWLLFSPSKGSVFCFCCLLLGKNRQSPFVSGCFNNWKKREKVSQHENGESHLNAVRDMAIRKASSGTISTGMERLYKAAHRYWVEVLKRCVAVITLLAERGLAFRGANQTIGSPNNGNYLGIIELLAQFDPFLSEHVRLHANRGRGHPSYLSKDICEEFILLMAAKVTSAIGNEVKEAKYFSISVDSTPDLSHIDQLTVIIRYVHPSSHLPIERFLAFQDIYSHTGKYLAQKTLDYLTEIGLDVSNCRGQAYDNASNMSGIYRGMQEWIKRVNRICDYIPCANHSLNLVGNAAAQSCIEAVSFFGLFQKIYVFFSSSTRRWALLMDRLGKNDPVLKNPSQTRWSARQSAVAAISKNYQSVEECLSEFAEDQSQPADARSDASACAEGLQKLESGIMCETWMTILDRLHGANEALESSTMEVETAVKLVDGLVSFIDTLRNEFDRFEDLGKQKSGCQDYKASVSRVRMRKRAHDESMTEDAVQVMAPRDRYRTGTYLVIIDSLIVELKRRLEVYRTVQMRFGFLFNFLEMSEDEISSAIYRFSQYYSNDVDNDFVNEFASFRMVLNNHRKQEPNTEPWKPHLYYLFLHKYSLCAAFPNFEIAYRIFLSLMVTNCSGERSFSQMKRIKNELRATMSEARLSALSLCIESEVMRALDWTELISSFAAAKSRKARCL